MDFLDYCLSLTLSLASAGASLALQLIYDFMDLDLLDAFHVIALIAIVANVSLLVIKFIRSYDYEPVITLPTAPRQLGVYVGTNLLGHQVLERGYDDRSTPFPYSAFRIRELVSQHRADLCDYAATLTAEEVYGLTRSAALEDPWFMLLVVTITDLRTYNPGMLRSFLMQRLNRQSQAWLLQNEAPQLPTGALDEAEALSAVNRILRECWWLSQGNAP
jgi:hypothetical protein